MKEIPGRIRFIVLFWIAIMVLVWVSDEESMPLIERLLCFFSFTLLSILISFVFSKRLFQKNVTSKTLPLIFLVKFLSLTVGLVIGYFLLYKVFGWLEVSGVFDSSRFIARDETLVIDLLEDLPGIISMNLLFCGMLLYHEYSSLQNVSLKYQLKVLDSQINPHFMFNVLNHIYVLMQKDVDMASALLLQYSETLRYQLYSGKKERVPLEQEIQFLKNYIDVEKFRWEGKLEVTCTWQVENGSMEIPPLLLIVFIENAFKHVSRSGKNKGSIQISLKQTGKIISLEVENSKSTEPDKKLKSTGIGLENVKARLKILYPKRYSLSIRSLDDSYCTTLVIHT